MDWNVTNEDKLIKKENVLKSNGREYITNINTGLKSKLSVQNTLGSVYKTVTCPQIMPCKLFFF